MDSPDEPHVRLSLGLYLLGALDAGEREEVERHLAGCATCRAESDELATAVVPLALVGEQEGRRIADEFGIRPLSTHAERPHLGSVPPAALPPDGTGSAVPPDGAGAPVPPDGVDTPVPPWRGVPVDPQYPVAAESPEAGPRDADGTMASRPAVPTAGPDALPRPAGPVPTGDMDPSSRPADTMSTGGMGDSSRPAGPRAWRGPGLPSRRSVRPGGARPGARPRRPRKGLVGIGGLVLVVLVSAGIFVGVATDDRQGGPRARPAVTLAATSDTATGAALSVVAIDHGDGVTVRATVSGLQSQVRYQLYAVTSNSSTRVVATWRDSGTSRTITGELPVAVSDLSFFTVSRLDGTPVVSAAVATR